MDPHRCLVLSRSFPPHATHMRPGSPCCFCQLYICLSQQMSTSVETEPFIIYSITTKQHMWGWSARAFFSPYFLHSTFHCLTSLHVCSFQACLSSVCFNYGLPFSNWHLLSSSFLFLFLLMFLKHELAVLLTNIGLSIQPQNMLGVIFEILEAQIQPTVYFRLMCSDVPLFAFI